MKSFEIDPHSNHTTQIYTCKFGEKANAKIMLRNREHIHFDKEFLKSFYFELT